ncbi:MAG: hypothetical protein L6U16_07880 [Porphyromonadaceae bacterium]|nr:MAG: hypothetical protein L6U16_07880 [Porphyromonadaceae bacterium]
MAACCYRNGDATLAAYGSKPLELVRCCYRNGDATVSFKYFEKCVQYAATHLSLESEGADLIKQAREAMVKGGVVNIDYGKRKCQAIPPTFIKSPFSTISNQKNKQR